VSALVRTASWSLSVTATKRDGTATAGSAARGYESASTSPPTPGTPGAAVSAATLAKATAPNDGSYWITDLAARDGVTNWQLFTVQLGSSARTSTRDLNITWRGHGEPTPGYPTALYVWNTQTSSWDQLASQDAGQDTTLAMKRGATDTACLRCHSGTTPSGVTMPASVTNVGATWSNATSGDLHGDRAGTGWSGSLVAPYTRGFPAIRCETCHDPHGSANLFHIPETVNGKSGISVTSGSGLQALCGACHQGAVVDWHQACNDCHNDDYGTNHWGDSSYVTPGPSSDCSSCHRHGATFTHPDKNCHGCHLNTRVGFPPADWSSAF